MGLRISPLGWGVVAVAALGLVLGRWFGWLELAAVGAALTAVLVVSLLMTAGRARYLVTLDMADRRVKVGERAVHLMLSTRPYHEATTGNAEVERHLGVATTRNLTVITKLTEKWGS